MQVTLVEQYGEVQASAMVFFSSKEYWINDFVLETLLYIQTWRLQRNTLPRTQSVSMWDSTRYPCDLNLGRWKPTLSLVDDR